MKLKRPQPSTSLSCQDCIAQQSLYRVGEDLCQILEDCTGKSYSQENCREITKDRKLTIHSETNS